MGLETAHARLAARDIWTKWYYIQLIQTDSDARLHSSED